MTPALLCSHRVLREPRGSLHCAVTLLACDLHENTKGPSLSMLCIEHWNVRTEGGKDTKVRLSLLRPGMCLVVLDIVK